MNSVAESGQSGSLHPSGAPIIHSTKEGFRRGAGDGFPASDSWLILAPLDGCWNDARASTDRLVIVVRSPPGIRRFIAMCASGDLLSSFATGVGNSRRWSMKSLSSFDLAGSCHLSA